jgi:disulfide bond formation protein DsbB
VPLGIKSINQISIQPVQGRLNAPATISLLTVAVIPGQRLSPQAAGSTSQATSRLLDVTGVFRSQESIQYVLNLSTTAYLMISFFSCLILRLNHFFRQTKVPPIKQSPQPVSLVQED